MNKHSFTTWVRPLVALLLLATGYANAFADMWLVGSAFNGWNEGSGNVQMTQSGNIYYWYGNLESGKQFAFFKDGTSWSNQRGPTSDGANPAGSWESTSGGSNHWDIATTGTYLIVYYATSGKTNSDKAHIEIFDATTRKFAVTGDAFGAWNMPPNSTTQTFTNNGDGTYTLNYSGASNSIFKLSGISQSESFTSDWDGSFNPFCLYNSSLSSGANTISLGNEANMTLPISGDVTLTISNVTPVSCTLTVASASPAVTNYYVAGSFTNWGTDKVQMTETATSGVYTATINNVPDAAQFKFVSNNGSSDTWTGAGTNDGDVTVSYSNCTDIALSAIGSGGNINISGSGDLTFTLNTNNNTFSVSGLPAPATPEPKLYLAGTFTNPTWDNGKLLMTKNLDGTYSVTVNGINDGAEFKFVYDPDDNSGLSWRGGSSNPTIVTSAAATTAVGIASSTGGNNYQISGSGNLTFTVAADLQSFTVTGWDPNNVTIHLIDKAHGTTPNLYAQVTGDNSTTFLGEWPGTAVTNAAFTTETIKGETWWKTTISTTAASIQVTPNIGGTTWQTKDLTIDTSNSDWYIVLDSWVASPGSNKSDAACAYSAATAPAAAVKHSTTWYLHGTVTTDQSWAHNLVPTDNGDDTYKWTAELKSGYNYYFFVSDLNSSNWDDLKPGHIYSASASDNTSISLGTEYNCVAQTVTGDKGLYHYYSQASAVHYFTYNAKTGKLTVTKETIDPNTGKLYLIGLVAPEGQTLTNEWAANLGVEMTKATDVNKVDYFYINNVKLMSLNSGFGFATRLGSDADDWTTLNACRYGAKVVNTGDTQKVLYTEMIQTGTEGADNDPAHWHEMYGVGESQNTFTVEISDTYNIIFYPAHDGMAPSVHLYATSFPDVMYAITGVVDSSNAEAGTWDLKKPVQLAHDTENDVYTAEVSLSPGTLLTFSRHLGNWEHINSSRYGAPSGTGTNGYWIQNNNLGNQITGLQSGLSSWSDNNAEAFVIKTNKSGLFRITLSTTDSWVKFEQLWETKGDKVHVYLEATENISTPLISAYDKESWSNDDGGGNIHVDRPKFSVLIGTDPAYSNKHRLCLAKDQAPAAELHETADKRTWYSWEIDHTIADFILTNNGKLINAVTANADDTDTADEDATNIIWRHSGEIYLRWNEDGQLDDYTRDYDETAAQEAPVVTKMIDGHYYCYFINTAKWPQSYIHAWFTNAQGVNEDLLGAYPGKQMTDMVGYDEAGNEVWLFDFGPISSFEGKEPTGIIFSIGMDNGMQTGDYEFVNGAVYDYTGTVVLGRDLANIIAKGVKDGETRYIIEDDIVAVYYDSTEDALYCKDLNKYITVVGGVERSVQQDGEIDYSRTTTNKLNGQMASDRYDQSNWIKLIIHNGGGYDSDYKNTLEDFASNRNVLKAGTVRGVLPNVKNPTMEIITLDDGSGIQTNGTSTYASNVSKVGATLNVFTPAHFVGSQPGRVSGRNYFFVTPKPNEYARVTWAVCTAVSGSTATFAIPESKYQGGAEFDNEDNLKGGFTADLSKVPGGAVPTVGNVYSFPAIIRLNESSASPAPRRAPASYNGGDAGTPAYDYVVYPLSLSDVTTGVTEVSSNKTVANVTYVNIAGMQSNEPFDGVNIVVTTYTDGTRSAVKVIK